MHAPPSLDRAAIRAAPKVLLHDHLDGGLRAGTVVELARELGLLDDLPAPDAEGLRAWFRTAVRHGGLEGYLAAFRHTVAVMQTPAGIRRVARECAEDLAADGVVYAEVRFAPELHTRRGMDLDEIVAAVVDGFAEGSADRGPTVRLLLTAMRDGDASDDISRLAVRWRDRGVVGFDLAGPEAGHPAERHREAARRARDGGLGVTIHAGEGAGPDSIAGALRRCGADRIGHGVRIVEDLDASGGSPLAQELVDRGVPLEVCPSSNVDTGIAATVADHPIERLRRAGFTITVNTDNRLMSGVTLTDEFVALHEAFGWGAEEFAAVSVAAARAAFCDAAERERLLEVVAPAWAEVA